MIFNKAALTLLIGCLLPGVSPFIADQKINRNGLIIDLNADKGVFADENSRVERWINQAPNSLAKEFIKRDDGRRKKGSGMPSLLKKVPELNGHNTIAFNKQELVSQEEDAFDHLLTGNGYTWFCVLKAGKQSGELKDVNSFFGNLKNGGNYEGIWAGLNDNNSIWMGSRNGITFGRWDKNNPYVTADIILKQNRYYILMGRMGKGTDTATLSLYLNDGLKPVASDKVPVNTLANASKFAIGQERDAIEHPGRESFIGEISRFLLYDRPLSDQELDKTAKNLKSFYKIPD